MSDQRMPEMTGVEFLRQVKRLRPDATRLLFTGYADIKAVIDAINEGHVFRYITKPWDPDELEAVIRQAVEQHDLLVERRPPDRRAAGDERAARRGEPAEGGVHRGRQPRAEHAGRRGPGDDRALEDDRQAARRPRPRARLGRPDPGRRQAAGRHGRADAQAAPGRPVRRARSTCEPTELGPADPRRRRRPAAVPRGAPPAGRGSRSTRTSARPRSTRPRSATS